MSQPPSLPKLTTFLRPGQQQQQEHSIPAGSDSSTDKRRLEHHASPSRPPMYAHDDSELLHEAHRQKRRANMFVQYGDAEYHPSQQQPQHQPMQVSGDYDLRRCTPPPYPVSAGQAVAQYGVHAHTPSPLSRGDPRRQTPPAPFRGYSGDAYGASSMVNAPPDARRVKTEPPEPIQRERKSRYLSEHDRRSIITRIDHGEKQVALAKEYQVSRAAICNLYKNRKEVLTRTDRDAKSKPAKRTKSPTNDKHAPSESRDATATAAEASAEDRDMSDAETRDDVAMSDAEDSSTDSIDTNPATAPGSRSSSVASVRHARGPPVPVVPVYNASVSSYPIRGLVSMLRNAQLPQATLRQVTTRLVRCLMEEALACLPRREANVLTSAGDPFVSLQPIGDDQFCAISMESQGSIMLQALVNIFPSAATALVSTTRHKDSPRGEWMVDCYRLPHMPDNASVLLLALDCATGTRVASVLAYLVGVGHVKPTNIYVAIVISSQPGLALVHERFPGVTVVSAAIDDGLDEHGRIRPGLGNLMDRFLHQES